MRPDNSRNNKSKKTSAPPRVSRKNVKDNNEPDKMFTVDNKEINKSAGYGDFIAEDKVISSDRTEKQRIILNTFIGNSNLSQPNKVDTFVQNSFEIAERGEDFIPWIENIYSSDEFINESIKNSGLVKEFSDNIEQSDIINIGSSNKMEVID